MDGSKETGYEKERHKIKLRYTSEERAVEKAGKIR